jgi:CheY-like chemotaxis protein
LIIGGQKIHIAALTAYASEAFEKRCLEAGMDTFLTKPVNDEKIYNIIRKMNIV